MMMMIMVTSWKVNPQHGYQSAKTLRTILLGHHLWISLLDFAYLESITKNLIVNLGYLSLWNKGQTCAMWTWSNKIWLLFSKILKSIILYDFELTFNHVQSERRETEQRAWIVWRVLDFQGLASFPCVVGEALSPWCLAQFCCTSRSGPVQVHMVEPDCLRGNVGRGAEAPPLSLYLPAMMSASGS